MGSVPRRRSPSSSIQSATRGSWTWWRRRRRTGTSGWTLSPTLWPLSRVLPSKGNTKCESQKKFVPHFKSLMLRFLGRQFQKADANKSGFLSFDEIKKLCHRLNIKVNKEKMQTLFNEANTDHDDKSKHWKEKGQVLNEEEFVSFYYSLMRRPEIDEIFRKYVETVIIITIQIYHLIMYFVVRGRGNFSFFIFCRPIVVIEIWEMECLI